MMLIYILLTLVQIQCIRPAAYTDRIFSRFGSYDSAEQRYFLTENNLTDLLQAVLSGDHYKTPQTYCMSSNCTQQCVSIISGENETATEFKNISTNQFEDMCPRLVYYMTQDCVKGREKREEEQHLLKPSSLSVWGYGFLFVTLINLCSLAGIFVLPLMKKSFYSNLLMFLIALAVGSLSANGILVLIPEAFEIIDVDGYIWKACSIVGGVYLFFVTERILKMITEHYAQKKAEKSKTPVHATGSIPINTYIDVDRCDQDPHPDSRGCKDGYDRTSDECSLDNINVSNSRMSLSDEHLDKTTAGDAAYAKDNKHSNHHGHSHGQRPVATVAWMIIFGDAFHNFIDGLSIGAAFSDSIMLGVSICIAVLCEELPHELGDFAILLNAGMSKKKALLFNFLSACTCYIGLAIGISLSEVAHATPWILGAAGGMFLYISLADMMPEMNHAAEENKHQPFKVFFIQNLGLLSGFAIIFIVSHFGGQIDLRN